MASKRDCDEKLIVAFRGKGYEVPIHWRSDAEIQRRYRQGGYKGKVYGFTETTSGHIWISHEANQRKVLDHELEHILVEVRQWIYDSTKRGEIEG